MSASASIAGADAAAGADASMGAPALPHPASSNPAIKPAIAKANPLFFTIQIYLLFILGASAFIDEKQGKKFLPKQNFFLTVAFFSSPRYNVPINRPAG